MRLASSAPAHRCQPASVVLCPASPPLAGTSVCCCLPPPAAPVASTSLLALLGLPEASASFTFDLDPHKVVLFWHDWHVCLQLEHKHLDTYFAFVDQEYALVVSRGIAASSSGKWPAKHAQVNKGKGKVHDEGPEAGDGTGDGAGPSV